MPEVKFYDNIDDSMLEFAVIVSMSQGKYVFCKHRERNTYEIPAEQTYPLIQPKLIEELKRREKMMIQKEQKNND